MNASLAMVFPGQGAQSVGMVAALAGEFPELEARYRAASSVLGCDLWKLVNEGPADELNQTRNTQPALLAASVGIWDVWCRLGGARPALMAGHSFGEYSALVCAGALRYEDAVQLVATRGRLMQEAVAPGEGAMAAILGLDLAVLQAACREAASDGVVDCANLNAPGQVVISGSRDAVTRAGEIAKARGAKKVVPLAVSVPAHSGLMMAAAARFESHLAAVEFAAPSIPVVHNVDVETHDAPADIRAALLAQLARPVRWQETIERFARSGVSRALECGPGKVLGPLIKRCADGIVTMPIATPADLRTALASLNQ
ncbi:MAG: ACP S-malonyltransferase [Gammaproteobacteria bacterium]